MATSTRGGSTTGKEKRGLSPSSSTIKRTPKPLGDDKSNSPTNTTKSVPSYLRSTKSASLDPNKQPKKPSTDASVSKPTYTRRRSFDRPPPTSQVQRAIRGGTTGGVAGGHDIKTTKRSNSFSPKSATSPSARPSSEKLYARTSSLKDGKIEPNLSKSRSVKKSNLSSSTKKQPTTHKKKAPMSVASESCLDSENRSSVDHLTLEDDLASLDDHEVQSLPEMSEMPDRSEELSDPTNVEEEDDPHVSTIEHVQHSDEEKPIIVDQVTGETEHPDSHYVHESADVEATEEKIEEAAGNQHDDVEDKAPEVEPIDMMEEEAKEEENVSLEIEAQTVEVEPTEAKDESQIVSSPITDCSTPKIAQPSSAGKNKQDYNDVIEETATKLMGGRKNKVLALAGAFETVISLEGNNKG